jgi:predicted  nucleic acid-binding Zn-ribbon protein
MQVEVRDVAPAQARLERAVGALGGQVARVEAREDERADYVIRVPADRLAAAMDSAAALGRVESRTVSAEDVTERVLDAEARLGALRASRDRLRQLVERAATVQDVVAVERELARVQGELESLEARLNALRGQVAMSELAVGLRRPPVLGPLGLLLGGALRLIGKLFVWR